MCQLTSLHLRNMPIEPVKNDNWTLVIEADRPWTDLQLKDLWLRRGLIFVFVKRDFIVQYKQTILGPLWHFLQPLITTLVFTVVFGKIAKIPTDSTPPFLFYMSGIVVWTYFSGLLISTADSLTGNAHVFRKIYFPRLIIPLANMFSRLISFGIQFFFLLCFTSYFVYHDANVNPNLMLLALPLMILMVVALAIGVGLIVAAVTVRYRDLAVILGFGVQLWMYASPIVYPLSILPPELYFWAALNPMTPILELFRYAVLGSGSVQAMMLVYSCVVTILLLGLGLVLFNQAQRTFIDTV
ncbi:MAG: lipopolysaccharide transport system permease protein [Arenicella sp.]|jgi:lipopolysaccharide transport system permease protein